VEKFIHTPFNRHSQPSGKALSKGNCTFDNVVDNSKFCIIMRKIGKKPHFSETEKNNVWKTQTFCTAKTTNLFIKSDSASGKLKIKEK